MSAPSFPMAPDRAWAAGAGFWAGVDEEQLRLPSCSACSTFAWYPLPRCPRCHTKTLAWTAVEPVGEVYSHTTIHRAFVPGFEGNVPHTVVSCRFPSAPGVTFVTALADRDQAGAVEVGAPLRIVFPVVDGGHRLALAELTADGGAP